MFLMKIFTPDIIEIFFSYTFRTLYLREYGDGRPGAPYLREASRYGS